MTFKLVPAIIAAAALLVAAPCVHAQAPTVAQTKTPLKRASAAKPVLVALHVDQNEPAVMNLALNNAQNIVAHYKALAQPVTIEIVTYGPGLHMLRDDKSPVKQRITALALEQPNIAFVACANTRDNMQKAEGAEIKLLPEARIVPSGVVRLIELQKTGYAYIKP
jgi:uncharacterized protein